MTAPTGSPNGNERLDNERNIRAPRGPELNAKSWQTEAPLRMLMNNLDAEVAERPEELVVYGGIGRAARDWNCFDTITRCLKELNEDETLLVQSGKPVGIFKTHADAPRVLIANSNLVPHWANWDHFNKLDKVGLMMYGQMTAGSWIYIGSQGIVQGTYETFVEVGRQHYGGDLTGKWILTGGLGGMGGAQPLAATMAGASHAGGRMPAEPDRDAPEDRLSGRPGPESRRRAGDHQYRLAEGRAVSVGLLGNAAEVFPELVETRRAPGCGHRPDLCPRSAERLPARGLEPGSVGAHEDQRPPERHPRGQGIHEACRLQAMLDFHRQGIPTLDYGNNIRQMALEMGVEHAFDFPGFVPAYIRPLFCRGVGPFRWCRPFGRSRGHLQDRRQGEGADAGQPASAQLARHGQANASSSRVCRHASAGSAWAIARVLGLAFNEMVAKGELSRRRSLSDAIIWIPARSPARTARPKA